MAEPSSSFSPPPSRRRNLEEMLSSVDVDGFDWKAYEATYRGRALITRLSHIPNILLSPNARPTAQTLDLARTALSRLIPLLKSETWDHPSYLRAIHQAHIVSTSSISASDSRRGSGSAAASASVAELTVDESKMDVDSVGHRAGPAGARSEMDGMPDMDWVESVRENERKENSRLDVELRGYLSNLIKESIRLTYLAFAQLSVKVGDSQSAMKNYGAAREYSTSPQHHVDLGVGIVETLLAFNQPASLPGHISKLEATLDRLHPALTRQTAGIEAANITASDIRERRENEARSAAVRRTVMIRIRVAKGLVALYNREWSRAAGQLGAVAEVEGGLADFEGRAISSADLALVTAFCTLASGDRATIHADLLERASFKSQIDDHDSWILDLVRAYVDARYGEVMRHLQYAQPILLLNPFLTYHAAILVDLIQTRCVKQYVLPFSTIKIPTMARSFGISEDQMLALVEGLVTSGDINGKIDLIDQVLALTEPDHRGEAFRQAIAVGKKNNEMTQAAILRMRLVEAKILVDPRPKQADKPALSPSGAPSLALEGILGEEMDLSAGSEEVMA
ncbi:hypothetical protein IAU60_005389 [Kwoniella sp. DSM 27419]